MVNTYDEPLLRSTQFHIGSEGRFRSASFSGPRLFRSMNINRENRLASSIQGQLLRLNERREVAIYLRDSYLWVGDFIDGHAELNFGDDRLDAAHGLGKLLHSEGLPRTLTKSPSRSS
jgi:hypothetical protein